MSEAVQVVGNINEAKVVTMEVESTTEKPVLPHKEPVDGEETGGAGLQVEKEAGSPKGQQGLFQSPGHAKEGDGGGSSLGLNMSETSTIRPFQQLGSQSGEIEEELGGEGTPPPPRAWIGDTRIVEDTVFQTGNGNSLPATNPQVVVREEEAIGSAPEPGAHHPSPGEGRGKKRKPSQDDSEEVKKIGKTEAVDSLSSQLLDRIQFQIVGAGSPPLISPSQDEVLRAVESILQ